MTFERQTLGEPYKYKGSSIVIRICTPCVLCEVDGSQVGSFWTDWEAGLAAGKRHIDDLEKEVAKKAEADAIVKRRKK